jgi:Fic family protein
MPYTPPLTITSRLIDLVSRISEALGRWEGAAASRSPKLRRENRIRSIHASLAVENHPLSHAHQSKYYAALAASDKQADAAPFSEFFLGALLATLEQARTSDPVCDPASDPVSRLLDVFQSGELLSIQTMMERLQLRNRTYFRRNFLTPAVKDGKFLMTQPDSPNHPSQRYRLPCQAPSPQS